LIVLITAGAVCYAGIRRKTMEKRLIDNFMKKMRKYGYDRTKSEGLREFFRKVDDPKLREKAQKFVEGFEGLFYRDRKMTKDDIVRLKQLLDDL
jgi:hypothetical protein